jgi:quinol monooxygenase YgiN
MPIPWSEATVRESTGDVLVFGSQLRLRAYRHIPGFLLAAQRVRKQVMRSPGAIGVSLMAQPLKKTFWTLSVWTDQGALDTFVRTSPHIEIMRRYHDRLRDPVFRDWSAPASTLPKKGSSAKALWADAKRHIG